MSRGKIPSYLDAIKNGGYQNEASKLGVKTISMGRSETQEEAPDTDKDPVQESTTDPYFLPYMDNEPYTGGIDDSQPVGQIPNVGTVEESSWQGGLKESKESPKEYAILFNGQFTMMDEASVQRVIFELVINKGMNKNLIRVFKPVDFHVGVKLDE